MKSYKRIFKEITNLQYAGIEKEIPIMFNINVKIKGTAKINKYNNRKTNEPTLAKSMDFEYDRDSFEKQVMKQVLDQANNKFSKQYGKLEARGSNALLPVLNLISNKEYNEV